MIRIATLVTMLFMISCGTAIFSGQGGGTNQNGDIPTCLDCDDDDETTGVVEDPNDDDETGGEDSCPSTYDKDASETNPTDHGGKDGPSNDSEVDPCQDPGQSTDDPEENDPSQSH